ncbi:MAG TPA: MgtC/SapB family protein [Vicinamibacterales bacterium]|nr:MgtC/SapB family protein [Vicinamibacterales bacterium]
MTLWDAVARLALAALLGAVLGFEREVSQKPAGLRTNILITLGSALFTIMSIELAPTPHADPTRIAAQIVTGIGFLGGGAILRTAGDVRGLTTAATIWLNAAIGLAAGGGAFRLAVVTTVIALLVLTMLKPLERYMDLRERRRQIDQEPGARVIDAGRGGE